MRSNAMLKHIFLCINIILLSFYILTSFAYTMEENVRENYYKAGKCLGDYYLTNDDAYLEKGLLLINKAIERKKEKGTGRLLLLGIEKKRF